jgi:hypothetical protein
MLVEACDDLQMAPAEMLELVVITHLGGRGGRLPCGGAGKHPGRRP